MNLLVIIIAVLVIWRAYRGLKKGFAYEANHLISIFMALIILSIALLLIASIIEKNPKTIILSIALLVAVSFIHSLIGIFMKSVETLSKLPVLNLINSLLGMIAGVLEVLAACWIMYVIVSSFPTGAFGEHIMSWTNESTLLTNLYNKNYIAHWIAGL